MVARDAPEYRTLASISRINLLHELQQRGAQTVAELARATGLHHNTAREHLQRLIDAGFVDSEPIPTAHKGRPRLRYRAARGADSPSRAAWLASSEKRSELVRRLLRIDAVPADRTTRDRQMDVLDDHMDQCGFDAEIEQDGTRMSMHHCPFADLAKDNPQVCRVHFTLVQDALDTVDGPMHARDIHPFEASNTCTIDLESD